MTLRHRQAPVTKSTYLEYRVHLRHAKDPVSAVATFCGLCGNRGKVSLSGIHTPAGYELATVDAYCICPNGRVWKYQEDQHRKRSERERDGNKRKAGSP